MKPLALSIIAGLAILFLNSCVPLAVGAAAGYMVRDEGYTVQSPLKKTED